MHPDVLNEPSFQRGLLSRDPIPEFGRVEATRRILLRAAAESPYPRCSRCGRALLALARTRFACPDGHVVITLPGRRPAFWQWARALFAHPRVGARA